jgi:cAMP-specific phosphodiesterase 4
MNHFDALQRFALVFSGLVHDIDHTGKTNLFEVNLQSQLATLYNDRSVLEHHHLAVTYSILNYEKSDIF